LIEQLHKIQQLRVDYLIGQPIKTIADSGDKIQIYHEGLKNRARYVTKNSIRNFFNTEVED
jgi:hypothetical protein